MRIHIPPPPEPSKTVSLYLPDVLLSTVDTLVCSGRFRSRSQAISHFLSAALEAYLAERPLTEEAP